MRPHSTLLSLPLLALAACTDATPDPVSSERLSRGPLPGGLRLGVAVDRDQLVLGDTAYVTVSLTNPTAQPVTLDFPSGCHLQLEAQRVGGGALGAEGGGYMCTQALTQLRLGAGQTVTHRFQWTHTRYDYPPYSRAYQAPGRIAFRGVLLPHAGSGSAALSEETAFLDVVDTAAYGAEAEVAVSASIARSPVAPGDTVTVAVTLRNLRRERVTMRFTSTCHVRLAFHPDAAMPSSAPASVVGEACGDALTALSLAAGESRVQRLVWRAVDGSGAPLREGGYTLRATLGVHAPELRLEAPRAFVRVGR